MENQVLKNIKNRRSIKKFTGYEVTDEELEAILEAGRWAPSRSNSQPWRFIVIQDRDLKKKLADITKRVTIFNLEVAEASAVIAVCVNQDEDPDHYVEDGAVATQNMALAAQSLGLASYWVGTYSQHGARGTAETEFRDLLGIPKKFRLISLLPIGKPAVEKEVRRKNLSAMVFYEKFGTVERQKTLQAAGKSILM